jgi:Glycosyl transferase family 2
MVLSNPRSPNLGVDQHSNVAATPRACLDSVARQTCKDFELVLVDGGSTDGTPDLVFTGRLMLKLGAECSLANCMQVAPIMPIVSAGDWTSMLPNSK